MNYIEITGNKARLFGDFNQQILSDLDMELSYKLAGIEYSPAFKSGRFDGRTRLLSSNLSFPVGLTQRVIEFFKEFNIDLKVIDNNQYQQAEEIDISDKLRLLNISPRYYQINAMNAAIKEKIGIIRVATGGGKTLIAALIVSKVSKNRKTAIYVVGKSLLWQFKEFFDKLFPGQVGVIGDGVCDIKQINICSIWSVGLAYGSKQKIDEDEDVKEKKVSEKYYSDIRNFVSSTYLSIMDEVHVGAAETFQKICRNIYSTYRIGMSATPNREDNSNLLIEGCFGKIIINISASELINKGYLVQPIIKFISVPRIRYPSEMTYRQIYSDYIVSNDARNNLIVKAACSLIEQDFATVVVFKELAHGKILNDKLLDKKIDFEVLSGKDDSEERKRVLDKMASGKIKLLLGSSIMNVGVDLPIISGIINASANKSRIIVLQRIGRGLRLYKDKDMTAIIDFYDQARYLKNHSDLRRQIYEQEPGFKVIPCKEML